MKVDLEDLADEAKRLRAGQKKVRYPVVFRKSAVAAWSHYRYEELVKRLGVGLSTLQKWKKRYSTQGQESSASLPTADSFTFAPILSRQEKPLTNSKSSVDGNILLEFTDQHARSFKISMPWGELTANKVFKLFEQSFAAGGH